MPNLRTRKSTADSRVTLFTLADDSFDAGTSTTTSPVASTSTLSPRTRRSASVKVKAELDSPVMNGTPAAPATPVKESRKRSRTSTLKEESDIEYDAKPAKKSPSKSRPSSPTKLRAKLEIAHPEPPRWRETYEIVGVQNKSSILNPADKVYARSESKGRL